MHCESRHITHLLPPTLYTTYPGVKRHEVGKHIPQIGRARPNHLLKLQSVEEHADGGGSTAEDEHQVDVPHLLRSNPIHESKQWRRVIIVE